MRILREGLIGPYDASMKGKRDGHNSCITSSGQ